MTPPVAFCPSGKQIRFQATLLHPENYPQDKETLFFFKTLSAPGSASQSGGSTLEVDYAMTVKLFYRPAGLSGTMNDAIRSLEWSDAGGNRLRVKNNSGFNVTIAAYAIEGATEQLDNCIVPPSGELLIRIRKPLPANAEITWAGIDDFGAAVRVTKKVGRDDK